MFLQTFVLPGKSVSPSHAADRNDPSNQSDVTWLRYLPVEEVWSWKGCLGRCVNSFHAFSARVSLFERNAFTLTVVTGASEGIGREFALQLAQKGFNVLVAARNATALSTLTAEIGEFVDKV